MRLGRTLHDLDWPNIKPHKVIGPAGNPLMHRWFVLKVGNLPRVYIHKFLRSDDDRALHDHPWWFVSIILHGSYIEVLPDEQISMRRAGSIQFRRATDTHRVVLIDNHPVWTLFITGPVKRMWGFWCDDYTPDEDITGEPYMRRIGAHFIPGKRFNGCGE